MFVNVKNCVTTSATLPGSAEMGIMKPKLEAMTTTKVGRKYWKIYFWTCRFISTSNPKLVKLVLISVVSWRTNGFILIAKPSAS